MNYTFARSSKFLNAWYFTKKKIDKIIVVYILLLRYQFNDTLFKQFDITLRFDFDSFTNSMSMHFNTKSIQIIKMPFNLCMTQMADWLAVLTCVLRHTIDCYCCELYARIMLWTYFALYEQK